MNDLVKIHHLEDAMRCMPQAVLNTTHHFADGMYARVLARPAGTLIVGKVHRREHFYICAKGLVQVYMDNEVKVMSAGEIVVSKPGTKRAVLAIEDSVCLTIHRTKKRNLDRIEKQLIEPDDRAMFDSSNKAKLDVPKFRALTKKIIYSEKPGFWSDWTVEQQALYTSGDWRGFSVSRGYSDSEISEYGEWREMIKKSMDKGLNPYPFINDLATAAALANAKIDRNGEILKSSHLPFASREKELT